MKRLKIHNLILIDKAEIEFGPGLNILTGETGSGKSAILSAIRLIAGERADVGLIRNGAEWALVEAEFEGPIFIRREIYRSGKNRCFIDEAQVSLTTLKERVQIEMVDQNSSILNQEKRLLDLFTGIESEVAEFEKSSSEEKQLSVELENLLQIPKDRELEWAKKDLELIEELDFKTGDEEKLAEEHHFLTHSQGLAEKMSVVAFALSDGAELSNLKRALSLLDGCSRVDSKLQPITAAMKGALLELDEVGNFVQSYADRLETDPNRLEAVEKRMASIASLKRRFGDIEAHKEKLLGTIDSLSNIDEQIKKHQEVLFGLREKNWIWSASIADKRKKAAPFLAEEVMKELVSLNIPFAQFKIEVDTQIRFLFSANSGHPPVPIQECASGGELSRLLLAIKTILADGESTLVFDEIDSNVGGQTASVLGEKIKKLGAKRQVICVTHFVQVAKCAIDHFLVSKEINRESTFTRIRKLSEKEKETEYNRMLGCIT